MAQSFENRVSRHQIVHQTKGPWQVGTKVWGHDRKTDRQRKQETKNKTHTQRELGGWDLLKSL